MNTKSDLELIQNEVYAEGESKVDTTLAFAGMVLVLGLLFIAGIIYQNYAGG